MKTIVHQGKRDRIVIEDGKNQTPAQVAGAALRELRCEKDLSMRQLAPLLGMTGAHLSDAENGRLPFAEIELIHRRTKAL